MHVGAVVLFERHRLSNAVGGVDIDRIRKFIDSKLDRLPHYRQRLARTPLTGSPVWVDDDHFEIDYHVRHTAVPAPGDDAALKALLGRLLEPRLDRSRPLWEMWVIDSLSADRFALFSKVHHCMVDGASGMHVMGALFESEEDSALPNASMWEPRPQPSGAALLVDELSARASTLGRRAGQLVGGLRDPAAALSNASHAAADVLTALEGAIQPKARTPLNTPVGPHRRVEWCVLPLADWKAVRQSTGATINDVALAVLSGALRHFLAARAVDLDGQSFRVCLPVNVRPPDDDFRRANRVSAIFADLPLDVPDPLDRLERIRAQTSALKTSGAAHGTELLGDAVDLIGGSWLTRLGVFLANAARPHNLIVTNVRGPDAPMYMLGARVLAMLPFLPLFDHQGLGVAITSLCGEVHIGFVGDRDILPDIALLAEEFERASEVLLDAISDGEGV
jgi:WS/DGAT/MGAT family acyltransferase